MKIFEILEATGQVDYLSITGATPEYMMGQSEAVPAMWFKTGLWVDYAAEVKRNSNLAILIAGRITDPMQGEWIVSEGKADLVAMTRAMIADPHLANKAKEGRVEDIRPCIGEQPGVHRATVPREAGDLHTQPSHQPGGGAGHSEAGREQGRRLWWSGVGPGGWRRRGSRRSGAMMSSCLKRGPC